MKLPSEIQDEVLMDSETFWILKGFGVLVLALLILITICIWSVNYQKNSSFSTIAGEVVPKKDAK